MRRRKRRRMEIRVAIDTFFPRVFASAVKRFTSSLDLFNRRIAHFIPRKIHAVHFPSITSFHPLIWFAITTRLCPLIYVVLLFPHLLTVRHRLTYSSTRNVVRFPSWAWTHANVDRRRRGTSTPLFKCRARHASCDSGNLERSRD